MLSLLEAVVMFVVGFVVGGVVFSLIWIAFLAADEPDRGSR